MKLELHCHSHYSKGTKLPTEGIPSPMDIIKTAKSKGLDGVALTDHNQIKGWGEARKEAKKQGILFIPGIEISSSNGHIIGLGINHIIKQGLSGEETMEKIKEQDGIVVAPHPFDIKRDGIGELFRKADAAEVFNSLNLDRLSNILMKRKIGKIPGVAGSDAHTLEMVGNCVNIIEANNLDDVLNGIKNGKVEFVGRYAKILDVRDWAHQRLSASRDVAFNRIEEYSTAKGWISKIMLRKFLNNKGGFFTFLSYFGITCSYGYGALMALKRI